MENSFVSSIAISGNRTPLLKRLLILRGLVLFSSMLVILGMLQFTTETINYRALLTVIGLASIFSLFSWFYEARRDLSDWSLTKHVFIDVCLVIAIVWFSGRSTNPFIYYLLVTTAISASIFQPRILWFFTCLSITIYTALVYLDLNKHLIHMPQDFRLHLAGMWLNFVGSALLISFFISRLTTALRDRERLLADAREQTLKNEQLIGIGTLAASTVHSLGTPLSTIAITIGELKSQKNSGDENTYLDLIQSQIDRCKQTMKKLSLLSNKEVTQEQQNIGVLFDEIYEYFLLMNADPVPNFSIATEDKGQVINGGILLKNALINLIDNAVHAAASSVTVSFQQIDTQFEILIEDDGAGIPETIAETLGKPLFSTKENGMGIGIFLANSTIEKLGGKVHFYSEDTQENSNTKVIVTLPRM